MDDQQSFDLAGLLKDLPKVDTPREQITYLPYAALIPDPKNGYSMDGIEELARSIELVGLQQPPRVKDLGGGYYGLISGHRRHAAIGLILKRDPCAFSDGVPCIVERPGGSVALRELQLLLGNSDNRKMTDADNVQQLERLSDCIRRLEAEGYKFPGRHRDWLSKMSGLSKTKIARLEAIQKHLSTTWLKLFTDGKLSETVAYALQQIPEKYQELLYDLCVTAKPRVAPASLIEYTVKNYGQSVSHAESMVCTVDGHGGEPCVWKEQLIREGNARPGWSVHYGRCSSYNRCSACCSGCDRLAVCESVCPRMQEKAGALAEKKKLEDAETKTRLNADRAASREAEAKARAEREAKDTADWARIGARRRELGLSCADAYGLDFDEEDEEDIASFTADMEDREAGRVTGASWEDALDIYDTAGYCALADRLQCSVDWLMGRSETPQPVSVPDTAPEWQTGDPPEPGDYLTWCRFLDYDPDYEPFFWDGSSWIAFPGAEPDADYKVFAWAPCPPRRKEVAEP